MIFPSLFSWIFADVGKVFGGFLQCQLTQNLLPTTAKKSKHAKQSPFFWIAMPQIRWKNASIPRNQYLGSKGKTPCLQGSGASFVRTMVDTRHRPR